jgi:hypothetical protein
MLIRECAPLCLAQDSGWGGVSRGWAWIGATSTMRCPPDHVKSLGTKERSASADPSPRSS